MWPDRPARRLLTVVAHGCLLRVIRIDSTMSVTRLLNLRLLPNECDAANDVMCPAADIIRSSGLIRPSGLAFRVSLRESGLRRVQHSSIDRRSALSGLRT